MTTTQPTVTEIRRVMSAIARRPRPGSKGSAERKEICRSAGAESGKSKGHQCPTCRRRFRYKYSLRHHRKALHRPSRTQPKKENGQ